MAIDFNCPQCRKTLRVGDEYGGKQAQCPSCSMVVQIPLAGGGSPPQPFGASPAPSPYAASPPAAPGYGAAPGQYDYGAANPYSAPQTQQLSPSQMPLAGGPIVVTQPTVGEVFGEAWRMFQRHGLKLFLAMLVIFVISWVLLFIVGMVVAMFFGGQVAIQPQAGPGDLKALLPFIISIYILLLLWGSFIHSGMINYAFKLCRGAEPQFGELFSGGRYYLKMLGLMFLFLLIVMGVAIIMGLLSAIHPILGLMAYVVGLIYIMMVIWSAPFALVDQNVGPIQALRLADKISKGNKLTSFLVLLLILLIYFGFFVVQIALISMAPRVGGILSLILGLVFACAITPYLLSLFTVMYLKMTGQYAQIEQD